MTDAAQEPLANGAAESVNGSSPLRALCILLRSRIEAFLQKDVQKEKLRNVQAQTRTALDVVLEALDRYPYDDSYTPFMLSRI